jgi:nitrogen regulatory protein P-II 1
VELLPKLLVTIFVRDSQAQRMLAAIRRHANTGHIGDGKIFVSPVENAVRVRTGEEGEEAL